MTARYGNAYKNTMGFWGNVDELHGLAGDDILDGRWGSGLMYGGKDNDTYYIDGLNDQVVELADEGHDKVYSSINYTLRDNVEDLELTGNARDGTGNNLQNHIIGNDLRNILDGRGGADTLEGGRGDDIYIVDVAGDEVIEDANEGIDTVYSTATAFTLDANVENLYLRIWSDQRHRQPARQLDQRHRRQQRAAGRRRPRHPRRLGRRRHHVGWDRE